MRSVWSRSLYVQTVAPEEGCQPALAGRQAAIARETYYAHDDWDKRTENICPEDMDFGNGHSHCMAMLLGPAGESVPVRDGELCLGTWQRVLFIELDRERDWRWLVQVLGN
jgi:thiamine phosphate synthase YjbQ (UPF0047 family)